MERGVGAVIKISLPKQLPAGGGVKLEPRFFDGNHDVGNLASSIRPKANNKNCLPRSIRRNAKSIFRSTTPKVCRRTDAADLRAEPWKGGSALDEFRQMYPERNRDGQMFVRIMEHVYALDAKGPQRRFVKKWQHHYFGNAPNNLADRSIDNGRLIFEQATCSRCHSIEGKGAKLGPELSGINKKFQAKLINQIVRPSAEINSLPTAVTRRGYWSVLTGVVIKETDEHLTLLPNMLKPEKTHVLAKSSIDEQQTSAVSSMPVGLLDAFTLDEIMDLMLISSRSLLNRSPLGKTDGVQAVYLYRLAVVGGEIGMASNDSMK